MIFWDHLLGVPQEEVCESLQKMYYSVGIHPLAKYLGVSVGVLRRKLILCGVPLRKSGGSHPRVSLSDLSSDTTAAELAASTGYTVQYARKLLTRLRKEKKRE